MRTATLLRRRTGRGGGLRLPGTAGNFASSADSVLNSVTGDIDIRVCAKLDDWTTGTIRSFVTKRGTNTGFQLRLNVGDALEYIFGTGSGNIFVAPSAGGVAWTPPADGATKWLRVTHDVDNGAGNNTRTFYQSDDGITWAQIGMPNVGAGVTAIAASGAPMYLGGDTSGTVQVTGTIFYAEIRAGIDGEVVSRFDASRVQSSGAQVPATINGWTLNGTALYRRDDYVRLPGTASNFLSYPDTSANSVTGDIDLRAKVSLDDWTPAASATVITKRNVSVAYQMYVNTDGTLHIIHSASGADVLDHGSTAATGLADGVTKWLRATLDVDNGAGGYDKKFYTSDDGVTWAQLGTTVTSAVPTSIFASADTLDIGARTAGTVGMLAGNVYAAEVRAGIDGPVVASFDARDIETPWTLNGTGWSWEGASFAGKPVTALSLPGTSGNYVSTPDSAGVSVVGDIDVRAKVTADSWTTGNGNIAAKWGTGGNSWFFSLTGTNTLYFQWSVDGSAGAGPKFSDALGFTAGSIKWVRVTLVAATGVVKFYSSDDGVTWTGLGAPSAAGATSIYDGTNIISIGARDAGGTGAPLAGKVHYAEVRNGIDGPIVARFDPAAIARTGTRTPATTVQPGGTPNRLTPNQASIETDATGWATGTGAPTLARSTAQFLDGVASLSIVATAVGPADFSARSSPVTTAPVVPGKLYTARASFRAAVSARNTQVQIFWHDAAQAFLSAASGSQVADITTGWTEVTVTGVAPANAAFGRIDLMVKAGLATEEHFVDRISLVESAATWTMSGSAWDLVQV